MRRFYARGARFSPKVLRAYAATGIAAALAVRAAAEGVTEILLYDEISYWGINAKDFVLALAQAGDGAIHLRINSPGGDAFEGLAIYNALKARAAPVTVTVDGIAASAASFVAMAGSTINMPEQAMLMLHDCWGVCVGNRNDMLEMATVQEKIDGMMAEIYSAKSGKTKADMAAVMDAETWYTSTEAKAAGLCDVILPSAAQSATLAGARILARTTRIRADDPAYPACDPDNPDPDNPNCDEMLDARRHRNARAQLPPYDPDGDGDNDAEEALGMINSAVVLLQKAAESLSGAPDDDEAAEDGEDDAASSMPMPIVPGASAQDVTDQAAGMPDMRARRLRLAEAEAA